MITQKEKYSMFVNELKTKIDNRNKKIIFLCIGTNKVIGDSFGALVGTNLQKLLKDNKNIEVFGNIDNPIHALNIKEKLIYINNIYKRKYIIAVDSAISEKSLVGEVFVTKNKMDLGKGIYKEVLELGDISIKCSVCNNNYDTKNNLKSLQNVSVRFITDLSNIVSLGIYEAISNI